MATAKRLPSGSYRARVYSHSENGKKIYESFTAPTKREAEMQAAEWANQKERHNRLNLTVKEAIDGYINAKDGVLSPSTIRAYRTMLRNNYKNIEDKHIQKITSEDLQIFVSSLAGQVSPKTVRNIYGLLSSALSLYIPDVTFRVTLPQKRICRATSPSNEDIKKLFENAPTELKKCICLAAFCSLRRGEICALTYGDIEGNSLRVSKDMVQNEHNKWIIKDIPKTSASTRDVILPEKVLKILGAGEKDERIVKYQNPASITTVFSHVRNKLHLDVRFHDLRHYFASIGAILNIPDTYLSDFGGWTRGGVMKTIYQNNIVSMSEAYSQKMAGYFDGLI